MQQTIALKLHPPLLTKHNTIFPTKTPNMKKPLICFARKKRTQSLSQPTSKLILRTIQFLASDLKLLPQPLDLVIETAIGGGNNDGGSGFVRGFGGGGFGWWGRRRRRRNVGKLVLILCVCCLVLVVGREVDREVFWRLVILGLLGVCFVEGWRWREVKDWAFGFCLCEVMLGIVGKDEVKKFVGKFGKCRPVVEFVRKSKRALKAFR